MTISTRTNFLRFHNGEQSVLQFSNEEYEQRLSGLRRIMADHNIDSVVFSSMHNIAYYSGFLYCAFGRPYIDVSDLTMQQRMHKSPAEIELIKHGAAVADVGGFAIRDAIKIGTREIDVAMAGRDAMELEIAKRFPDAEYRDTWVWFQSGLNTDGAHNPVTSRKLERGDILSLNTFPMISGYYTALERTLFVVLTIPDGQAAAGGYREHDILVVGEDSSENITKYPYGPEFNVVPV